MNIVFFIYFLEEKLLIKSVSYKGGDLVICKLDVYLYGYLSVE